jgi:two-component system, LuxR family, sensor kinase FixL
MTVTESSGKSSANLLAAIVESSEDSIVSKTLDGIVTSWNTAAERMFGYTAEEMIGQPIAILATPATAAEMPRILETVGRGERVEHYETERRRKDGQIIQVAVTISPVRDDAGRIVGASKIARDITAAKRDADELIRREALLGSILATVPDAMVVIDERGIIQSFSAAAERMLGYPASEVCGRNVSMLMPTPHRERHDGYIARYLATGERRIIGLGRVVSGRRKDGSEFPLELSIGELHWDGRQMFTGFLRDLTERQQTLHRVQELQAELTHVSRLTEMGQMASALAHEVNQPLTAATNYLEAGHLLLARGNRPSTERARGVLEKAAEQLERATQLVRRLRDFARKGESERRPEPIRRLIDEAAGLALIGARDGGIKVQLQIAPELPDVAVDRIQVQQVVVNLIRNAIEAMESERRELTISAAPNGDGSVAIRVADTGPGLAPEVAERLFEPFVTTKPQGMGIGLSICRSIIEAHGGELHAEPNPGGGTVFAFSLPMAPPVE